MTAAEMFCERVLDGITNWDKPKDKQDEENVAKAQGSGEKAKVEKVADGGNAESAIDAAIAYLESEGDEPTRRNVFAKDWALKKQKGKGKKPSKTAQDELYEALVEDAETLTDKTLAEHDKERHPHGYHEGDTCKFRENMMVETETDKADEVDADKVGRETTGTAERHGPTENKGEGVSVDKPQAKVYDGISKKKVEKYKGQMAKKHPELDADLILTELGKIKDTKLQGDAFAWVMKGAVRLPEDMYKVEQARELATKAKRNPLDWNTPQACINELMGKGHKIKEKPITVDELKKNPLMSDYRDEGYGVETFQVEDSKEGQALMRQVIDTHWGKDANPWCLLARDDRESRENTDDYNLWLSDRHSGHEHDDFWMEYYTEGNRENREKDEEDYRNETGKEPFKQLLNAWKYWNHYNALPKRVAFKNGKLLAFMATDAEGDPEDYDSYYERMEREGREPLSLEEWQLDFDEKRDIPEEWWDRQDASHNGIPIGETKIPDDMLNRKVSMAELVDGKVIVPEGSKKYIGKKGENGYREWDDRTKYYTDKGFGKSISEEDVPWREVKKLVGDLWMATLHRGGEFSIGKIMGLYDKNFTLKGVMNGDGVPITEKDENYPQYVEELSDLIKYYMEPEGDKEKQVSDELVIALIGENYVEDADTLPQGETLEEHDRKRHKGHFDPSTQTCKFREEMKKETDADRADEISPESAPKVGGGEDGGQKKPLVSPEEDKAYMEAVERGDMETAAKMVREVAAKTFPNTKVIDKDGKPSIVFHGTAADFTEFDPSTISRESGNFGYFGKGFYFAGREDLGDYYAFIRQGKRMNEFVDIQNPFVYNDETIAKIAKEIGLDNDLEKDWSLLEQPSHFSNQESVEKFTEAIKGLGYDGVLVYDRAGLGELVAFKPNQIKSADPVTYDDDGNIIPLSRRFDDGDDIRGDVSGKSNQQNPQPVEKSDFEKELDTLTGLRDKLSESEKQRERALREEHDFDKAKALSQEQDELKKKIEKVRKKSEKLFREEAKKGMPNTKVLGKDGLPLIVYHGTVSEDRFTQFADRPIFAFHREGLAAQYTSPRRDLWVSPSRTGRVIPMVMNLENPYIVDAGRKLWNNLRVDWSSKPVSTDDVVEYAKKNGYDGVIIKQVRDNMFDDDRTAGDEYIAFKPSQVKETGAKYKRVMGYGLAGEYDEIVDVVGMTTDDQGNTIPMSRRFDSGNDIRGDVSVGGDDKPSSVEQEESENLESYEKNFTEDGEWKSPWGKGGPTPSVIQESRDKQSGGDEPIAKDTFELPNGTKVPASLAYLYKGMDGKPHNEKWSPFLEKTTGNGAISNEFNDVLDKLFSGELVDADTIKSIPEWKDAMQTEKQIQDELERKHGVRTTAEIRDEKRSQLHKAIVEAAMTDHISKTVPVDGFKGMEFETNEGLKEGESYDVEKGRVMTVVIGLPAAGKSTTFANPLAKKFKARLCDSDTVKKTLPEFHNGYGGNVVHEESTKINEEILKRSIEQGDNIVYPILGYKPEKLKKLFGELRDKGYKINLCLKDMPANIALGRLLGRFMGKGRYLPVECITKAMGKFGDCFEQVKGLVDAYVRSTSDPDGTNERVIESKGDLI